MEKADRLVGKRQYKDASALYKEASELFRKNIGKTDNEEVSISWTCNGTVTNPLDQCCFTDLGGSTLEKSK